KSASSGLRSAGSVRSPPSVFPQLRVERVTEAITEEVQGEQRDRQRQTGVEDQPRRGLHQLPPFADQRAPRRVGSLYAEPEERQKRLLEHHGGDGQRRIDDD